MKKTIAILLASLIAVSAFAKDSNLLLKENYKAQEIKNISINLSSEQVHISPIYGDEISIEVHSNNRSLIPSVIVGQGGLSIGASRSKHHGLVDYCDIDLFIPYDSDFESISIYLSSAKLVIDEIKADSIEFRASSGSINISNIEAGELQVTTSSGSIRIDGFTGEYISTRASSGSIRARDISCDYFDTTTSSGSIEYELVEAPLAASEMRASSGSITLSIPDNKGFDIIASSSSGSFRDQHTGNRLSPRHQYSNSYYGGGSEIRITTSSGSITLEK